CATHFVTRLDLSFLQVGLQLRRSSVSPTSILVPHAHAHHAGHTRLLHSDAVNRVGGFRCGAWVMRDHDELRVLLELVQHAHETPDILVVQRCINLVEQAERTWLRKENAEEQRERHQCAFTTGKQVNALCTLSARRRVNFDVAIQRRFRVLQAQVALSTSEQRHENLPEVLTNLCEGGEEQFPCS